MVVTLGQMDQCMKAAGKTASKMELPNISIKVALYEKANGRMVLLLDGLILTLRCTSQRSKLEVMGRHNGIRKVELQQM